MSFKKRESGVLSLARKELRKHRIEKNMVFFLFLVVVASLSVLLIFFLAKLSMTAYANYVSSQGGMITELTIYDKFNTTYWSGVYGLALRVADFTEQLEGDFTNQAITRQDLFFDCISSSAPGGPEVYASLSPSIDFESLVPATASEVDSFTGCSGKVECAVNTYTENMSVSVGANNITGIPSTHTYKYDGQNNVFDLGVLSDGSSLVYVTHIEDIQKSYNEEKLVNFQMLLPVRSNQTETYYFFTDPNDVCPSGGVGENIEGEISGYVFDTSNSSIENVTVSVAGYSDLTDENGFYNISFTVLSGTYNIFAQKDGYDNYFSNITANFTDYILEKNITMSLETPGSSEAISPHVYGYVFDTSSEPVSTAKVLLGDALAYSDSTGYYSFYPNLTAGSHAIVSVKPSYNNYYYILNFTLSTTSLNHNITLTPVTATYNYATGPYATGPYTTSPKKYDEPPQEVIEAGDDFWVSTKEISVEVRHNTFIEDSVGIYNFRNTPLQVTFTLSPALKDIVSLDKVSASVLPGTFTDLGITIYGSKDIGEYNGTITIGGGINQIIPVTVKIVEKNLPIEVLLMDAELYKNVLHPNDVLQYKLGLKNLLRDQSYKVHLKTRVRDSNGSMIFNLEEYDTDIITTQTILRQVNLPEEVPEGDFVLEIEAVYLNLFSVAVAPFVITRPIYLYSFFGIPLWGMVAIISFISFIFLNLFLYRRYKERKKRYQVAVDFATLPKPAERVVKLGLIAETKHPAYYELEKLTTHAIVAGATGMGKSISAQVIIEEALMKNIAVIVFDPTAQWSGMLRRCTDKKMMSYYPKFGLKESDARAFKGNARQVADSRQLIDINKYVSPGQIQIFSLNKLDPKDIDMFVANVIRQIFKSDPKESPNLKVLLVFDEVHRLLSKFGGSGEGFLQVERACREFRKWGIGVMLISQVLSDFVGEIKANINTEVQTRTLEEGDLERIKTKYGEGFLKSLVRAEVGVAMFQNAEYNRGRPYFINFRPILHNTRRLPDEELEKYNKYNDMVDDLEFQIDELEKEKVDVFDLRMELKLVKDKVMSGSFSVVDIYLEGLKPRVGKAWEELGKKPPERKIELVSEAEIQKSVAEAKASREKFEKTEKAKEKSSEAEKEVKEEESKGVEEKNSSKTAAASKSSGKPESKKVEAKKSTGSKKTKKVLDKKLMKKAKGLLSIEF